MALRFTESFDVLSPADMQFKWGTAPPAAFVIQPGRVSGSSFQGVQSSAAGAARVTLDNQGTWTYGFAFQIPSLPNAIREIATLQDAGTKQCELSLDTTGVLLIRNNVVTRLTGTTILLANTWYYIEVKVTIGNAGSVEVHINGQQEASLTSGSVDVQTSANATANMFTIESINGGTAWFFDDLYLLDGTGPAPNNTFLGDVRVIGELPNGNGNSSQLVGSDGDSINNYQLVNEQLEDGDTTYVTSGNIGDKDTYAFADVPTVGTVFGVAIVPVARKTDAGTRSIRATARLAGVEQDSATDMALGLGYQQFVDIRETKPGGGSWTVGDVNSAEFGVKVTA